MNKVLVTDFLFRLNKFIMWEVIVPKSVKIICSLF